MTDVKFCGLTRPEDAAHASALGARYAGAIFAGGPREISAAQASRVFAAASGAVRRVGVFRGADDPMLEETARTAGLHVVQLHGDPSPADVERVRRVSGLEVWAVVRLSGSSVPPVARDLFEAADAVVIDARVPGVLGGSGVALPWAAICDRVERARGGRRLVVAGGLTPENVRDAIEILSPAIVDVSSGVESVPGIKDHDRMRAFAEAVAA